MIPPSHVLELLLRAGTIATVALVASFALKYVSARARKYTILTSFICLLFLPLGQFIPALPIPLMPAGNAGTFEPAERDASRPTITATTQLPARITPQQTKGADISLVHLLIAEVWITGTIVCAIRYIWSVHQLHNQISSDALSMPAQLLQQVQHEARALGLAATPSVKLCQNISTPAVIGVTNPKLVIPHKLLKTTKAKLGMIIRHELLHIRNRDLIWRAFAQVAVCCCWFLPMVWLLFRDLVQAQESVVDAALLEAGADRYEYAELLLEIGTAQQQTPAIALASRSFWRLQQILRYKPTNRIAVLLFSGLAGTLLLLSVVSKPVEAHRETAGLPDAWTSKTAEKIVAVEGEAQRHLIRQLRKTDGRPISALFAFLLPTLEKGSRMLLLYEIRDRANPDIMTPVMNSFEAVSPAEKHLIVRYLRAVGNADARDYMIELLDESNESLRFLIWHGLRETADFRQKEILERKMEAEPNPDISALARRTLASLNISQVG